MSYGKMRTVRGFVECGDLAEEYNLRTCTSALRYAARSAHSTNHALRTLPAVMTRSRELMTYTPAFFYYKAGSGDCTEARLILDMDFYPYPYPDCDT